MSYRQGVNVLSCDGVIGPGNFCGAQLMGVTDQRERAKEFGWTFADNIWRCERCSQEWDKFKKRCEAIA